VTEPFLRESAVDVVTVRAHIASLRIAAHRTGGGVRRAVVLGKLGDLLRTVGDAREAVSVLDRALGETCDDPVVVRMNRVRRAVARMYAGDHAAAESELRSMTLQWEDCSDGTYLDFAWHHLGQCLAEQGRWSDAERCFERAAALRSGGDPHLSRSSEIALALTRERVLP